MSTEKVRAVVIEEDGELREFRVWTVVEDGKTKRLHLRVARGRLVDPVEGRGT